MLVNLRYRVMFEIMKYITPTLHKRIQELDLKGLGINIPYINIVAKTPRPAIKFMKTYFKDKRLNGVEIGVNRGNNAKSILKTLKMKRLFLIDIWNKKNDYLYNYNEVFNLEMAYKKVIKRFKNKKNVEIIKDFSENAVKQFKDNFLDFAYIDANHEYNYVYQDINLWYPKIKHGGILCGHDISNWKGVLNAVKDYCKNHKLKFHVISPDWFLIKPKLYCEGCKYYNKQTFMCEYESITLNPKSEICVCYLE